MEEEGTQHMDDILYKAARHRGTNIPAGFTYDDHFIYRTPGDHNNALHIAAQHENPEFITATLAKVSHEHHYSLVCQKNSKGETPLHLAAEFGSIATVKVLLLAHDNAGVGFVPCLNQRKPCWSKKDTKGDTPLHKALRNRHEDIAFLLLDTDIRLVCVCNEAGESPAYLAAEGSCDSVLKRILDADHNTQCPVSFSGPFGQTVFHSVARRTKNAPSGVMNKLIRMRGALLKEKDKKGKTALHYAVEEDKLEIVETFLRADSSLGYLQDNNGRTPLLRASIWCWFEMINTILELSPQSVEIRDNQGKTVLHHVVKRGPYFLWKCLKNKTIEELINEVDNDGNTPLHTALLETQYPDDAFALLFVDGCNWRLKNNEGYSLLDLCKADDKISYKSQLYVGLKDLRDGHKLKTSWRHHILSILNPLWTVNVNRMDEKELGAFMDKMGVAAVLLLGVSFAATFSVPGGYDQLTGKPILRNQIYYQLYMDSEFATFGSTVFMLIFYTFGHSNNVRSKKFSARLMIISAQCAIIATFVAYYCGSTVIGNPSKSKVNVIGGIILFVLYLVYLSKWYLFLRRNGSPSWFNSAWYWVFERSEWVADVMVGKPRN